MEVLFQTARSSRVHPAPLQLFVDVPVLDEKASQVLGERTAGHAHIDGILMAY